MRNEKMQELMKRMQSQMEKIRTTANPQERRKLMQEHMQAMHEGMTMMDGMGGGKAGRDMMHGTGKSDEMPMTGEGDGEMGGMMRGMMMKRHMNMEKRMDMLEMMMQQMIEHEKAEQDIEFHG